MKKAPNFNILILILIILCGLSCHPRKLPLEEIKTIEIYHFYLGQIERVNYYSIDFGQNKQRTILTCPPTQGNYFKFKEDFFEVNDFEREKAKKIGLLLLNSRKMNYEGKDRLPIVIFCKIKTKNGEKYFSQLGQASYKKGHTAIDDFLELIYKVNEEEINFSKVNRNKITKSLSEKEKRLAYLELLSLIKFYSILDNLLYEICLKNGYYEYFYEEEVMVPKNFRFYHHLIDAIRKSEVKEFGKRVDFAHSSLLYYLNEANKGLFLFDGFEIKGDIFKKDENGNIIIDNQLPTKFEVKE